MAAPTVLKSRDASLKKLVDQERSARKVTKKNILCPEIQEWPRPSEEIAALVLAKISEVLAKHQNIFKGIKSASEGDQEGKQKIRSQLEIGVSAVFRSLEKGRLSCVLVSGQAKPATIVDHVISLARERGCPLLCLDALSPMLAVATKTRVFPLCLGFKILDSGTNSDFADIISLIEENAKVVRPPLKAGNSMSVECTRLEELPTKILSESLRPISVQADEENEIMSELKVIMSKSLASAVPEAKSGGKKRKRKAHANVKELFKKSLHCHFEVGKRSVTSALQRGKLQLVLLSSTIVPFLVTEPLPRSLLHLAQRVGCPVLCLPPLSQGLKGVCGANVSVLAFKAVRGMCAASISILAFKKFTSLPPGATPVFQSVVEKCLHILQEVPSSSIQKNKPSEIIKETTSTSCTAKSDEGKTEGKLECGGDSNGQSRVAGRNEMKAMAKEEEEEEDYSYLHVMKENSTQHKESVSQLEKDVDELSDQLTFTGSFISLGSESRAKTEETETRTVSSKLGKRKQCSKESLGEGGAKKTHLEPVSINSGTATSNASTSTRIKHGNGEGDEKDSKVALLCDASMQPSENSSFISFSEETSMGTACKKCDSQSAAEQETQERKLEKVEDKGTALDEVAPAGDGIKSTSADKKHAKGHSEKSNEGHSEKFVEGHSEKFTEGHNEKSVEELRKTPTCSREEIEARHASPLFTISRKGDESFKEKRGKAMGAKGMMADFNASRPIQSDLIQGDILGGELLQSGKKSLAEAEAEHITHTFDATRLQGRKKKRKQMGGEGAISLAYTQANIHTFVSDVSKKKKKKKKKK